MTVEASAPSVVFVHDPAAVAVTEAVTAAASATGLTVLDGPDVEAALGRLIQLADGGQDPAAIVVGPVLHGLAAARRLHAAAPMVHLVFVVGADGGNQLRRELALAPGIGTAWTVAGPDPLGIAEALRDAARSTRQRHQLRATLDRARGQLPSRALVDPEVRRRERDARLEHEALVAELQHERRRIARLEVTQALVDEPDLATAAPRILRALGEGFGWACGVLWLVDQAAGVLRCAEIWRGDPAALGEFVEASRAMTMAPGVGLPGVVWAQRAPLLVADISTDPRYLRAGVSAREGLHTGWFHPIVVGRELIGVVELIACEHRELDDDLREMIASAAGSIGQLAERGRIEQVLRQSNEALRVADRRKNEFLATLAHELRNPLAPIADAIGILEAAEPSSADAERARAAIGRQVATLTRLVDDLLDVARISTGKIQLRPERTELAPILARAVDTVGPAIERHGLALKVAVPSEPLWLDVDPVRIEQVVTNLLVNALKYTDRGGRVWLTVAPVGPAGQRRVVIAVRDTGIGLTEDLRGQVFDLFAQAPGSIDRAGGGLGIGLTLVKSLVELQGGEVAVTSAGPGKGSEFTVRLPVRDPPAGRSALAPAVASPTSRRLRVLIVDDNIDAADTLEIVLRRDGHEVRASYDGPGALVEAAAFAPEVILLDIGLPGMTGYEVASRLRDRSNGDMPVLVAITGWGQDSDRAQSRLAGFAHHLVKPARLGDIRAILAGIGEQDGSARARELAGRAEGVS